MSKKISNVIESICKEGCATVNSAISKLENGEAIHNSDSLTASERIQLIKELKEIMLVYNNR